MTSIIKSIKGVFSPHISPPPAPPQQAPQSQSSSNQQIPRDVLDIIFQRLNRIELYRASRTCKAWRSVAIKTLMLKDYPPRAIFLKSQDTSEKPVQWKAEYTHCADREKRMAEGKGTLIEKLRDKDLKENLALPSSPQPAHVLVDENSKIYNTSSSTLKIYDTRGSMTPCVHDLQKVFGKEVDCSFIRTLKMDLRTQVAVLTLLSNEGRNSTLVGYDLQTKKILWECDHERYLGSFLSDAKRTGSYVQDSFSPHIYTSRAHSIRIRDVFAQAPAIANFQAPLPANEDLIGCDGTPNHDFMVLTTNGKDSDVQRQYIVYKRENAYQIVPSNGILAFDKSRGIAVAKQMQTPSHFTIALISLQNGFLKIRPLNVPPQQEWQAQINSGFLMLLGKNQQQSLFLVPLTGSTNQPQLNRNDRSHLEIVQALLYEDFLLLTRETKLPKNVTRRFLERIDLSTGHSQYDLNDFPDLQCVVGRENAVLVCQGKMNIYLFDTTKKKVRVEKFHEKIVESSYQAGLVTVVREAEATGLMEGMHAMEWLNFEKK